MTTLEMLIDVLFRSRERFDRAFDGVTLEQANTQPTPDLAPRIDSLTWLAWHTARELDIQVAPLAGVEPVWVTGGHRERFALPLPDDTEDWRHTPEQAAQVVVGDLSILFTYLDDAYTLATTYLRSLTPETLDDIVDDSWDPPVTRAVRLASVIDDAAQHSGQAVYTRRLGGRRGLAHTPPRTPRAPPPGVSGGGARLPHDKRLLGPVWAGGAGGSGGRLHHLAAAQHSDGPQLRVGDDDVGPQARPQRPHS